MTPEQPKSIIVTGGASGIGYAFCEHLAQLGHRMVIADLSGAIDAAARLREAGHQAIGVQADVVSEADVVAMAEAALAAFGGIDGLVNNAGLFTTLALKPFEQISNAEWMRVMEVNTLGPFNCAKAVLPALRRSGRGRLVNIASTVPIKGPPNMAHYVASKGAVIALTRSLARELAKDGITVNAISPGPIAADDEADHPTAYRQAMVGRVPVGRMGRPAEVAAMVRLLASEDGGFINGQMLAINGGAET